MAEVVRLVKAQHSNLIEGNALHPVEIAAGLRDNYSKDGDARNFQRDGKAHVRAGMA